MMIATRPTETKSKARSYLTHLGSVIALSVIGLTPRAAHAEEPTKDYCEKVTAQAEADAALLFAPTAAAQIIRFPANTLIDNGFQIGKDIQPRAALSIGFIDIYKGFGVLEVARRDCAQKAATVTLEELLAQRDDVLRYNALERKLAFYREHAADIQGVLRSAEERFKAGTTTMLEVHELRRGAREIEAKEMDAERMHAGMKARGLHVNTESLETLVKRYEERTGAYEESVQHVRNLQPWKFGITGGIAPHPAVDWYGMAELSYNIGGLFSAGAESRAAAARVAEVKNARYEVRQQVEGMRRDMVAQARVTRKQIASLDESLTRAKSERALVESSDAPNKGHVIAALTLEILDVEAERAFLVAIAEQQEVIGGSK